MSITHRPLAAFPSVARALAVLLGVLLGVSWLCEQAARGDGRPAAATAGTAESAGDAGAAVDAGPGKIAAKAAAGEGSRGGSGGSGEGGIAGSQQCAAQCASDIIADGFVNIDDLLAVINGWGICVSCPPTICSGDVNQDCQINIDDLLAVISGWGPCPAPSNDSCAAHAILNSGNDYPFCTAYATTDGAAEAGCAFCCGDPQIHKDIWYSFNTSQFGGNYSMHLDTCGADFDTKIAVYRYNGIGNCSCSPGSGQLVACNDDAGLASCGLQSRVEFQLAALSCYLVRLGGYNGASGSGVLHTQSFYIGDDCFNAVNLGTVTATNPLSVAVVTTSPSSQYTPGFLVPQAPCTPYPDGQDVWYRFQIGCGGNVIGSAYTCDAYTDYDTIVTVYYGTSCDNLTLVGCNDDYTGNPACQLNGLYRKSLVDLPNQAGSGYYYVRVSGYNNAWGSFKLNIGISCIN